MLKKLRMYGVGFVIVVVCILCGCESDSGDSFDYGDNNPNVWVAVGDSITSGLEGEDAPYPPRLAALTGLTVVNEGISGEKASEGRARFAGVLNNHKPGRVMILYGVNDIMHHQSLNHIIGDLRYMVQIAKANNTKVALATLTPMIDRHRGMFQPTIEALNDRIRLMAAEEDAPLVDLAPLFGTGEGLQIDGLHPNAEGSEIMANAFR